MQNQLELVCCESSYGAGIYELGANRLRVFVTDAGNVLPVEGKPITTDDLIQAYKWGRQEQQAMDNPFHHGCGCGPFNRDERCVAKAEEEKR